MASKSSCVDVFIACALARDKGTPIQRESSKDKEFHFQNWFQDRLASLKLNFDDPGRNTYPDFRLVDFPEGYEVKGLATPGREKDYDANSQVPTGAHNGRAIFYLFGRYPADAKEKEYQVIDLVLCHGDFLNCDHEYVHLNKSFRGFGSYGDILVRDRKMYVAPTPIALAKGTAGFSTLILPADFVVDARLKQVGELTRIEANELIVSYSFDLKKNVLEPRKVQNPYRGKAHHFKAYRLKSGPDAPVSMARTLELPSDDE